VTTDETDIKAVQDFFAERSPEEMNLRFLSPTKRMPPNFLDRLEGSPPGEVFFIKNEPDGEIIGIADYGEENKEPRTADTALLIKEGYIGRGIGRTVLRFLEGRLRSQSYELLTAEFLTKNRGIKKAVIAALGQPDRKEPEHELERYLYDLRRSERAQ
jgi:hypothetical protein